MLARVYCILICVLICTCCATSKSIKNTTYSFEPQQFYSLYLEGDPDLDINTASSRQKTDLLPDIFHGAIEKLVINVPDKVIIDTVSIHTLVWEDAKVPICMRYRVGNENYQRMSEHYVFLKDIKTGEIKSASVNLDRYDRVSRRPARKLQDNEMSGGTFVYNITYFTDLPKYSTEYEVWVKIADLESNHIRIKLDLKERGRLITELPKKN